MAGAPDLPRGMRKTMWVISVICVPLVDHWYSSMEARIPAPWLASRGQSGPTAGTQQQPVEEAIPGRSGYRRRTGRPRPRADPRRAAGRASCPTTGPTRPPASGQTAGSSSRPGAASMPSCRAFLQQIRSWGNSLILSACPRACWGIPAGPWPRRPGWYCPRPAPGMACPRARASARWHY